MSAHAIKADGRVHFVDPSVALGLCNGVVVLLRGKRLTGTVTGLTCKFKLKTASGEYDCRRHLQEWRQHSAGARGGSMKPTSG